MPFLIVGLTGGIGTGKSSVSAILRRRNCALIDADEVARTVVEPGQRAYAKMRRAFGDEYFLGDGPSGPVDREKLARLVFTEPEKRRQLESITHPEIVRRIGWLLLCQLAKFRRLIFLDIPLLFETGMDRWMCCVVVVTSSEELQLQRLCLRDGLSMEQAQARIAAQMPLAEKVHRADFVIENNGSLEQLEAEVDRMLGHVQREWAKLTLKVFIAFLSILVVVFALSLSLGE